MHCMIVEVEKEEDIEENLDLNGTPSTVIIQDLEFSQKITSHFREF